MNVLNARGRTRQPGTATRAAFGAPASYGRYCIQRVRQHLVGLEQLVERAQLRRASATAKLQLRRARAFTIGR